MAATAAATLLQTPTALGAEEDAELEEVVITGTRIAKRDAVAESPIVTVDSEMLDNSGYTAIEHYLNTLPQVTAGISSQSNNPSSNGQAYIDLRGLGAGRNLVLIDGRRGMGSTSAGTLGTVGAVDVNTIPAALIDRVEVISGGAAAVYGADAIAGVVNFILKKRFTGAEIDAQYGVTEQGDGQQRSVDLTLGGDFAEGRGNAVFNFSYYTRDDMYKDAREFAAQASSGTGTFPGGSYAAQAGITQAEVDAIFGAGNCAAGAPFGFNPDGSLFCVGTDGPAANGIDYDVYGYTGPESHIATAFYPNLFSYNFEPDNILVLPMTRWNIFTRSEFEVNEHFRPYAQASFTNYNAKTELAPTPGSVGSATNGVPVTNPFIPAQLAALLAARDAPTADFPLNKRYNFLGGRTSYNEHDVWQAVAGATGAIGGSWSYDVFAQYGRSIQNEVQGGNVRVPRVLELLRAADGGASICAGGFNPFGDTQMSAACQAYISLEAKNLTTVVQKGAEAVVTGELAQLPAGPLQAAFGVGARDISLRFQSDGGLQPGQVIGFNEQLPVSGALSYKDYFTELSIPLLAGLPGVRSLSLTPGFRITDNNLFGSAESWKITAEWTIVDSMRVRGGFQRAVRAPNVKELYASRLNQFPTVTDPCAAANATAQVKTLCGQQYAPAGLPGYSSGFGQAQAVSGGNPDLQPETADSWTAGMVFSSTSGNPWLSGMTLTVDYWAIKLEDVIATFAAQTILNRCYNLAGNANPTYDVNNSYCRLFIRDPAANGRASEMQLVPTNQAVRDLAGVDISLDYMLPASDTLGQLGFNMTVGYVDKWKTQDTVTDPVYDYVRTIGTVTASATPQWKGTLLTRWSRGPASAILTTRFIDTMYHESIVQNPARVGIDTGPEKTFYFDLTGSFDLTSNVTLRAGINNLLDKGPQRYVPNIQANTDPSTYDVLGRRYYAGVNVRF